MGTEPPPTPPKLPMPAMEGKALEPHKHSQVHVCPLEEVPVPVAMLAEPLADADAVAIETTATVYVVRVWEGAAKALPFDEMAIWRGVEDEFAADETPISNGVDVAFATDETAIWRGVEEFPAEDTAIWSGVDVFDPDDTAIWSGVDVFWAAPNCNNPLSVTVILTNIYSAVLQS